MSLRSSQLLASFEKNQVFSFFQNFFLLLFVFGHPCLALCCPCAAARRPAAVCNPVEKSPTAIPFSGPCLVLVASSRPRGLRSDFFFPLLALFCFICLSSFEMQSSGKVSNCNSLLRALSRSHGLVSFLWPSIRLIFSFFEPFLLPLALHPTSFLL